MRRGYNPPPRKKTRGGTAQQMKRVAFQTSGNNARGGPEKVKGGK